MDSKNNNDREFAGEIKKVLKGVGNEKLSSSAQADLWERIDRQSIHKPKSYNWKLYMQIAAMLLLVSGIGIWQYQQNTPTHKLLNFAAAHVGKSNSTDNYRALKSDTAPSAASSDVIEDIITTKDFNTLVVGNGKRSVIKLPDGTQVWLNSGSRLIYPLTFSGDVREVYLEGEAYFDVTHDKQHPFHVRANKMDIKVLGTEFFVSSNADSDNNYAVLVEGSIAFSTGTWLNKIERQLVPGQRINFNLKENKLLISEVKTAEFQSWKEGFVDVQSESLDLIIQRVAKYYNIEISTQHLDLSNEKFSGRLDFQRSADAVLDILCAGTPYVYNGVERRLELRTR
ncbi:FecR family protein [Pedobacter sp. ok626]|uniref:FecR family protein n=1 Tax=Pedobacter sp. ok626 TaxID=1761882 RepID=UPI0008812D72|nr:FecR family protein [Pedobacter sp. ok626]SDK12117.1 FecR family protein [Pedobacter sp. ok626]